MTEPVDRRKPKLLVIGIDGGTYDLIDPMIERGLLPNIAGLIDRGFRADLQSTVPPNSAAAWATFMTGKEPGSHGVLRFQATRPSRELGREFRPGAYTFINSTSIPGKRIWDIFGDTGKRSAVINLPMTYPPRPLNGVMITGLPTPPDAENFTYPPELADSLEGYMIEQPMAAMGFGLAANRELVRSSIEILEIQGQTAIRLLGERDWDLFLMVFTGTDRLQHRLWHYLDPNQRSDELEDAAHFKEQLDRYYSSLDAMVGRLVEAAGPQANTIVLSDHGFGPAPKLALYRRALARELGLVAGEGVGGFHSLRAWLERHNIVTGDRLRILLMNKPLRGLFSRIARVAKRKEQEAWRSSDAYLVVLHKYLGGIGINVESTDPRYEALRVSLMEKLEKVFDPESGKKVITGVWRREEIFHGPRLGVCPDIVFRLNDCFGMAHGEAPGGRLVCPKTFRSQGIHRDEGILIMSGPEIEKARGESPVPIADVSATALYLLDTPIPSDLDGKPVLGAIRPDYRVKHPVQSAAPGEEADVSATMPEAEWRSIEDEDAVAEQLRDLGYLD